MTRSPACAPPVLELEGVHKGFDGPAGPHPVLVGVDLTLAPGEVVGLMGRSGSGKTTLLSIIAGLERADAGTVSLLAGGPPAPDTPWAEMAVMPQSLGLLGELTMAENVSLPLRLAGAADPVGVTALMDRLRIGHLADRLPTEVSLGEQQRAALARAAVVRPRLLLADEPISHQNDAYARVMMEVVTELASEGVCCLVATHNEVAVEAAHRVVELHGGRLRPAPR